MASDPIQKLLSRTHILREPKHRLATFGSTHINYHLISTVDELPDRTRVREGTVVSQRPQILTPSAFKERFEGFGDEAAGFARWISTSYRDLLRGLEYNFRNQGLAACVVHENQRIIADRMLADFEARGVTDRAVILCPDSAWSLALMKFTLDEAARSFPGHVRDLERRDMFSPDRGEGDRRRREVEALFDSARRDRSFVEALGRKLREHDLFEEYEDRFLSLF
ncbi:MAG: hypothetical protein AAB268_00710 [Elusimicrobiota bacterium]